MIALLITPEGIKALYVRSDYDVVFLYEHETIRPERMVDEGGMPATIEARKIECRVVVHDGGLRFVERPE